MVCKVLQHTGADICEENIESSHRLNKKSNQTIVTFSRRKDCEQVMRVKKDLKDLNPTDLDFPEGTQLFTNHSLCPYYKGLWNECKKLWIKKQNFVFYS